jgi:hypothetical protein
MPRVTAGSFASFASRASSGSGSEMRSPDEGAILLLAELIKAG